jgi:uncharacterized protein (DUF983 family)
MNVILASSKRLALAAVPVVGIFSTPFMPFAYTPTLWFGLPAVLVWFALLVILTVVTLQIVEYTYLRDGGAEQDRLEEERQAAE